MLSMDVSEFAKKITESGVIVLDVRTPEEFSEGCIQGARNIDFYREDFATEIKSLDKEFTYAVYCRSGIRSGKAIEIMQADGFHSLFNLDGGVIEWVAVGMPVASE